MIQSFSCLINKVPNSLLLAVFGQNLLQWLWQVSFLYRKQKKKKTQLKLAVWMCCFALDGELLVPMAENLCVKGERLKSLVMCFSLKVVTEAWSMSTFIGWFELVSGPHQPRSTSVYILWLCSCTCLCITKEKFKESEICIWSVGREKNKE